MKKCSICLIEKDLSLFAKHPYKSDGHEHLCKNCRNEKTRDDRKKNPEPYRKRDRKRFTHFRQRYTNTALKKNYNLDIHWYEDQVLKQNNLCYICSKPETVINSKSGTIRRLSVDHDHKTNKVRKLLCSNCNQGLGKFKDDPLLLEKASQYLREHV